MTVLNRLYASGGKEVLLNTLQITTGDDEYFLTQGWDNITATLEDGRTVIFEACGMTIALPARNADGTQDLKLAISNVEGIVSSRIEAALKSREEIFITYREYHDHDLTSPSSVPWTMNVKSGYWLNTEVQVVSGYMNILDTAWPRRRYNLAEHPGLRYAK